ncbi:hypothetical protein [Kitasatospora griseola]|uniref:hypothetical protein n=1 Tax=Kitasatospora griseola TaxID=2064 RepID=UPI00381DC49A
MLGDKRAARRHQEYLDSLRHTREREMRETLARAANLTGLQLIVRPDTWHHLRRRPHLADLLSRIDATRVLGDPADLRATMTVTLSGPQLVHLAAALFTDKETDGTGPAERAARAIAHRLYPVVDAAIRAAHPLPAYLDKTSAAAREVHTVALDTPGTT